MDFSESAFGIRKIKSRLCGIFSDLLSAHKRGKRRRNAFHRSGRAVPALFLFLYLIPIDEDLFACIGFYIAENMRMAMYKLVRYAVEHIFDGESSGFSFYIGMEHGLKHDIAELLAHEYGIIVVDRFDDLICFFYKVFAYRGMRLNAIPRAAVLGSQQRNEEAQRFEIVMLFGEKSVFDFGVIHSITFII